ncbi:MAG TPA: glutamine-hydrolyzing carbamoyl-phosphate synthase small subunit [Caldimonas sp.]|nr:glutamine-hydrolyzing carbamoyl-phosphate synthase small subunit [Caldimonas sp.]HEX2540581.1 glutamine-hydrolyzing carbamoyl-phosphate synthase small subunit [Caldimonas sp.]
MSPHLLPDHAQAVLALADGTVFKGVSIGAAGATTGEVVFNTALTGYQEILTDPSYHGQIVTLTYPHIGNYGTSREDVEAARVFAAGLVVKDVPARASNFRSDASLGDYLRREKTVGIAGIDTRRLTRLLRSSGAQNGCIVALGAGAAITDAVVAEALARARAAPDMAGLDLAKVVSVREPYEWAQTEWALGRGYGALEDARFHVVAYDFGVKFNILRMLAARGCRITVVPAETPAARALEHRPDGIFLANGPGDPAPCDYAIRATREFIERGIPTFGICLGHQIMALACGASTYKMKFGHHGANHPVKEIDTGRVSITSQNHGFAVDRKTLPATLRATHVSLFDGTLQGLAHVAKPAFCFQGHPEASPGPHDVAYLFDRFVAMMESSGGTPARASTGSAHA